MQHEESRHMSLKVIFIDWEGTLFKQINSLNESLDDMSLLEDENEQYIGSIFARIRKAQEYFRQGFDD